MGNRQFGAAPLTINRDVDFETVTSFTLNIRVQNVMNGEGETCSNCQLGSNLVVNVQIEDRNDNTPVFLQSVYVGGK